jgi:hypothetical protein
MEDHAEEALHMKIINKEQHHHDVHHGRVELETDVGGTDMEDYAEEVLHMKSHQHHHDVHHGHV